MGKDERFLVTGAMGCLGAWVIQRLLREGGSVVAYDLSTNVERLRLIVDEDRLADVEFEHGDITEVGAVGRVIGERGITHVIHLAAMQVPFVRADPPRGALVNVVGTTNVFEGVKAHRDQVRGLAFASSAAVFGPPAAYAGGTVTDDSSLLPDGNLYGVFKQANEWAARVYARDDRVVSVGLRPFVVYGPGRDQGMTSTPTAAIVAALIGVPYQVSFCGPMYFNFAPDTADAFIAAARLSPSEPLVLNVPGTTATVEDLVALLETILPESKGRLTLTDAQLPSPSRVDSARALAVLGIASPTPLELGVKRSIEVFRRGLDRGLIRAPV